LLAVLFWTACSAPVSNPSISIIPAPAKMEVQNGSFTLSPSSKLVLKDEGKFPNEVEFLQITLEHALDSKISEDGKGTEIELIFDSQIQPAGTYQLDIDSDKASLKAGDATGMFYALETFRQLLPADLEGNKTSGEILIPTVKIEDQPTLEWRGMHLDVSRHFFSIEYLHRYVDLLALYKMNKFHLHLTDDQGWRMEIKQYPELTEKSAWRTFNNQDSVCMEKAVEDPRFNFEEKHLREVNGQTQYGGFYTQEELRELVAYAQSRHIEIIPEIDMPGHMMAAIQVYPELACTNSAGWGKVFSTPLCPGKEEVYTFVENVLTEVMDVFPSKFIHIGADEVEKSTWESSKESQDLMKREGLDDVEELQTYFVERVTDFLKSKGKEVIVWDDALNAGLDPSVYVMYWRSWAAAVPEKIAANGNPMILVPGNPLYFSRLDAKMYPIYHLPLYGNKYPEEKVNLIQGMQAALWSETVPSEALADAIIFPKMLALAERAWSTPEVHDWESFKVRLQTQLKRLDALGVNYSYEVTKELIPFMNVDEENQQIGITLDSELSNPEIHYTLDGSIPSLESPKYEGEFFVKGSALVTAAVFDDGKALEPYLTRQVDYHKAIGKPVTYYKPWNGAYPAGDAGSMTDGLRGGDTHHDGKWQGFTNDIDVTIDMGVEQELNSFSATFMQLSGPGILMPGAVEVSLSSDGESFHQVLSIENDIPKEEKELIFKDFAGSLGGEKARYINVKAINSQRAFIFTDEIVIN
jgi:hexosaminidase